MDNGPPYTPPPMSLRRLMLYSAVQTAAFVAVGVGILWETHWVSFGIFLNIAAMYIADPEFGKHQQECRGKACVISLLRVLALFASAALLVWAYFDLTNETEKTYLNRAAVALLAVFWVQIMTERWKAMLSTR